MIQVKLDKGIEIQFNNSLNTDMGKTGYVYIMTNWNNQVIYTGVTSDLKARGYQHRNGLVPGFTVRYNCTKLVYYEIADDIVNAIQEKSRLKTYHAQRK